MVTEYERKLDYLRYALQKILDDLPRVALAAPDGISAQLRPNQEILYEALRDTQRVQTWLGMIH
jgi:hypothetical protein